MIVLGMTKRIFLVTFAVLAPALALAQPPGPPDDGPPPQRGRRGAPAEARDDEQPRRPGPPIMAALDTNRDGELSPEEIRNAAAALKSLDHNHDGTLDRSELEPRGGAQPGPDGPPDAPPRGGRLGGPPGGPDGPPDGPRADGPPRGAGPGRPPIGRVLPPFVREELSLSDRQQKQIADLESTVKAKLESILTPGQLRQLRERLQRGPGGPPGGPGFGGPGQRPGRGGGPPPGDGPPGDDDNDAPVRPRRP
jgi:hypothetical protein